MEQEELIRFRYETDETNKMDLSTFVKSLNGISDNYKSFLSRPEYQSVPYSLKIVEIRHKCIEIDLQSVAAAVAPLLTIENLNTGIAFLKRLGELARFFLSEKKEENVQTPTLQESQQFRDIISPLANGQATQFNGCTFNGNVYVNADNANAYRMIANVDDHIKSLEAESILQRERVLLTIYQARNSSENSGDKSIVDEISKRAIKTTFESIVVKNQMLHPPSGNPFDQKYLVDIFVTYKDNKPTEYRVFKLREVIPVMNTAINAQLEFDIEDDQ